MITEELYKDTLIIEQWKFEKGAGGGNNLLYYL